MGADSENNVEMQDRAAYLVRVTLLIAVFAAPNAIPQPASELLDIPADGTIIEEVLVTAIDRCGPWPIAHKAITECFYAELKRNQLRELKILREKYFDTCLSCTASSCSPRKLPVGARRQKFVCKRLFQTPRWVPRTVLHQVDGGYLTVTFTYNISANGKAQNIQLTAVEADLEDHVVLDMISKAALEARFEPITYQGKRLPLIGVEDSYNLEY